MKTKPVSYAHVINLKPTCQVNVQRLLSWVNEYDLLHVVPLLVFLFGFIPTPHGSKFSLLHRDTSPLAAPFCWEGHCPILLSPSQQPWQGQLCSPGTLMAAPSRDREQEWGEPPRAWCKSEWKRANEKWPLEKKQIWWSECSLENGNMSIREGNGPDRDVRNCDGWGEEEKKWRGRGFAQTDERGGERWNGGGLSWHRVSGREKRDKIEWVNRREVSNGFIWQIEKSPVVLGHGREHANGQ